MESQKTSGKIRPEPPEYEIMVLADPAELSVRNGKLNIAISLVSRMT